METLANIGSVLLLVFGFGFVIFWHELGHFLAAKAVGIKVEQFALGFGQALLCWRKGIGLTVGTSAPKYQALVYSEWEKRVAQAQSLDTGEKAAGPDSETTRRIAEEIGLGETEYRLNWVPMGGYVKMLGQDDLDPAVKVDDPRAYNNKPIASRMLVVSAGVIMNIILAAVLFMGLFLLGFNVPPALVGMVQPGSPAQRAGLAVGDRILSIDGTSTNDFNKIALNTALLAEGASVPVKVRRGADILELSVTPQKPTGERREMLQLGIGATPALRGLPENARISLKDPEKQVLPERLALKPGDVITAINGVAIEPEATDKAGVPSQYPVFDKALQASDGKPVRLSVRDAAGAQREVEFTASFMTPFGDRELNLGGIVPRPEVTVIAEETSTAFGRLLPGDLITAVEFDNTKDLVEIGSSAQLKRTLTQAGDAARDVSVIVSRNGQLVTVDGLKPNVALGDGRKGLGIGYRVNSNTTEVASVLDGSAAARAGILGGDRVLSVDGTPVSNMFELRRQLLNHGTSPVEVVTQRGDEKVPHTLTLSGDELTALKGLNASHELAMGERIEPRRTSSPLTAAAWGAAETRDFVLQGYVTIKRMLQRSISPANLQGPVGIFHIGGKIATTKPLDWLLWFLAMISANLAVVNFLPMPIVDGGLFVFLIIEKLMGRPLSPRTQSIAQIVGLAMILSVFLFVTYNDIARLL